jgi:hypothetical protein
MVDSVFQMASAEAVDKAWRMKDRYGVQVSHAQSVAQIIKSQIRLSAGTMSWKVTAFGNFFLKDEMCLSCDKSADTSRSLTGYIEPLHKQSLKRFSKHQLILWQVLYNPFHDPRISSTEGKRCKTFDLESPIETAHTFQKHTPIGRGQAAIHQTPQVFVELLHAFEVKLVVRTQLVEHHANAVSILMTGRKGCERQG